MALLQVEHKSIFSSISGFDVWLKLLTSSKMELFGLAFIMYFFKLSYGSRLKILTNKQMLNRLPILLAQIEAGNNSIKLKNDTRQILYSLYRSEALTKTVYNKLIKSIRA